MTDDMKAAWDALGIEPEARWTPLELAEAIRKRIDDLVDAHEVTRKERDECKHLLLHRVEADRLSEANAEIADLRLQRARKDEDLERMDLQLEEARAEYDHSRLLLYRQAVEADEQWKAALEEVERLQAECVAVTETAAQAHRDVAFYRDLLDQTAVYLGPGAFTSDDGSVQDTPLRSKVPGLVAALCSAPTEPGPQQPSPSRRLFIVEYWPFGETSTRISGPIVSTTEAGAFEQLTSVMPQPIRLEKVHELECLTPIGPAPPVTGGGSAERFRAAAAAGKAAGERLRAQRFPRPMLYVLLERKSNTLLTCNGGVVASVNTEHLFEWARQGQKYSEALVRARFLAYPVAARPELDAATRFCEVDAEGIINEQ